VRLVERAIRGAAAGAAAATAWSAAEFAASRALRHDFTDTRLLGRVASERWWLPAGVLIHAFNGAAFGAVFAAAGARGPMAGLRWVSVEALASWPGMALVDRFHPDRRSGRWPRPLLTDRRVIAQEAAMHALFGLVLGALAPGGVVDDRSPARRPARHQRAGTSRTPFGTGASRPFRLRFGSLGGSSSRR
jgi:hypothetical protein